MALTAGTRLGPYEIIAPLGAGGMGEVYRATDTNLARQVAIKVLPEAVASDAERLARFDREAKTLASLNHPNIAAIYGLERSGATTALVMELVEGPTLADRIERGAVPVDEALAISRQIADALEAAHEQGIIHRDLKPANIKVRADGTVKVLDFGLAKAMDTARPGMSPAGEAGVAISPSMAATITTPALVTHAGVVLGTAAYMSPEQARGRAVDRRADIWAFGCVVYEMLTGRRAFDGEEIVDVLGAVTKLEPDYAALPVSVSARIRRAIALCLRKDPKQRVGDIRDVRLALEGAFDTTVDGHSSGALRWWQQPLQASFILIVVAAATALAAWTARRVDPTYPQVARFEVPLARAETLTVLRSDHDLAISPDGTQIVYFVVSENRLSLVTRRIDELTATPLLSGGIVEQAVAPFISPDGAWIGFSDESDGTLRRVSIHGGPAIRIAVTGAGAAGIAGASWGDDGTIVFGRELNGGLMRVPATGGQPEEFTRLAEGETQHAWPDMLPGARAVLFTIMGAALEEAQIAVLDLQTGQRKVLLAGGSYPRYSPTGHIVYGIGGVLRAVPFDAERLEITGPPVPVVDGVVTKISGAADFALARNGTLIYVAGDATGAARRTLAWVDRMGREEPIAAPERAYTYPRISPDGRRVALDIRDQQQDIWTWDFTGLTLTRLTSDPGPDAYPVWTPDGGRLIFASARRGAQNLFWQAADGTSSVERLTETSLAQAPYAVTPDGTRVLLREGGTTTGSDLMLMPLEPPRRVAPVIQTAFSEGNAEIAPDGRWLAYESNESGRDEIYVRPFPDVAGGRQQVSTDGGQKPLWSRDGRELFYVSPQGVLMGVRREPGPLWRHSRPEPILENKYFLSGAGRSFDIAKDGQRFLMIKERSASAEGPANRIIVVQHWTEELNRLVPAN